MHSNLANTLDEFVPFTVHPKSLQTRAQSSKEEAVVIVLFGLHGGADNVASNLVQLNDEVSVMLLNEIQQAIESVELEDLVLLACIFLDDGQQLSQLIWLFGFNSNPNQSDG